MNTNSSAEDSLDFGATVRGLVAGQKAFGRFTLQKILGRGGMGVVWLAHDERLDRSVALKFVPELMKSDADALRDLRRETNRALELTHENIVRVYDFVEDEHAAAIAMEHIDGASLAARKAEQPNAHFEAAQVSGWLEQLCAAVDYAHEKKKIVHRDLKPANLMLNSHGELKVTDFGISATLTDTATRVSRQMATSGTPVYMSPQQMMGERPTVADDIYAIGSTFYEMLTGRPPFYSGNVVAQVTNRVAPTMTDRRLELGSNSRTPIPPHWEQVIAACLAKAPAERPASAREIWRRLAGPPPVPVLPPPPPPAKIEPPVAAAAAPAPKVPPSKSAPPPEAETPAAAPKPNRSRRVLAVLAVLLALVVGILFIDNLQSEREAARAAQFAAERNAENERERLKKEQEEAVRQANLAAERDRQRLKREQDTALEQAKQSARVLSLLDAARAADRPESARLALDTLEQLLKIEPGNRDALALKRKVEAYPRTLKVPGDFATIAAAMEALRAGDTLELGSGTFNEWILAKDNITVKGAGMDATFLRQTDVGVFVANGVTGVKLMDVTVEMTGKSEATTRPSVIQVRNKAQAEFYRVRIRNGVGHGFSVQTAAEARLTGCRFENNGWNGVYSTEAGSKYSMDSCVATGNQHTGIAVGDQAEATIQNSRSERNGYSGFLINGPARLVGNTAVENKREGFAVSGETAVVELVNNEARDSAGVGFLVTVGAKATFRNNRASNNEKDGFQIYQEKTTATFSGDEVNGGGRIGFWVGNATATFTNTTARGCTGSGFLVSGKGSRGTLTGIKSIGNGGNGLYCAESGIATLENVTVRDNKGTGVHGDDGTVVTFKGNNTITSNGPDGKSNTRLSGGG